MTVPRQIIWVWACAERVSSSRRPNVKGYSWPAARASNPSTQAGIMVSSVQPPGTVRIMTVSDEIATPLSYWLPLSPIVN